MTRSCLLNVALATVFLYFADSVLTEAGRKPVLRFMVLLLLIFGTPLPAITLMSMEHVLHLLLSVLAVHYFIRALRGEKRSDAIAFLVLMPLLCTVRYEGLFFLPPILSILVARRKFRFAGAVLVAALLPLVAFSAVSVSKGAFVLPNPVVIKGVIKAKEKFIGEVVTENKSAMPEAHDPDGMTGEGKRPGSAGRVVGVALKLIWRFFSKAWVFSILALSSIFLWINTRRKKDIWSPGSIYFMVVISVVATHIILAGIGRQYRYEVYIMGMGIVLLGLSFPRYRDLRELAQKARTRRLLVALAVLLVPLATVFISNYDQGELGLHACMASLAIVLGFLGVYLARNRVLTRNRVLNGSGAGMRMAHIAIAAVMLVFLAPIIARGLSRQVEVPAAIDNIYEQQYQMGMFVGMFYSGRTVAVNDIGAVAYLGNATILDLWGLADNEVLVARMRGQYDTGYIEGLLAERGVSLVIVYDRWFDRFGGLPRSLRKAGMWEVKNNVVLGGTRVSFYALDSAGLAELEANMREYEPLLPEGVTVYY